MEGQSLVEAYFKDCHQKKYIGRMHKRLCEAYLGLIKEMRLEFQALPSDKQIFLLAVPLKKQARFKREGVDVFVSNNVKNIKTKSSIPRYLKANEQAVHQHVANGGTVEHKKDEEYGGKNKQ